MKRKIFSVLIIMVFVFSLTMLAKEVLKGFQEEGDFDGLRNLIEDESEQAENEPAPPNLEQTQPEINQDEAQQILPQYKELAEINNDFVGWVEIENTKINYPVMHTPTDEEYYLHRNFDKEYSSSGTPFLAASNTLQAENEQIIIYGHNMRNGTMFKNLLLYKKQEFLQENPYIKFNTLYSEDSYEIFAAFEIDVALDNGHFPFYQYTTMESEEDFNVFLSEISELSLYDTKVIPKYGETMITLVTCDSYNGSDRFVVMGVKR